MSGIVVLVKSSISSNSIDVFWFLIIFENFLSCSVPLKLLMIMFLNGIFDNSPPDDKASNLSGVIMSLFSVSCLEFPTILANLLF